MTGLTKRLVPYLVFAALTTLSACTTPTKVATTEAVPAWLQQRIANYAAQPHPPVIAVHAWTYQGQTVYEMLAGCCDRFNELFDAKGQYICAPSGGFTGMGDGKCGDAVRERSANEASVRRIWPTATSGVD